MSEIEKKMDVALEGITAVQSKIDSVKGEVDSIDKDMIQKAGADAAKALEEIQAIKTADTAEERFAELKSQHDELAQELISMRASGSDAKSDPEYKHAIASYLRKGTEIDPEMTEKLVRGYVQTKTFGLDENGVNMMTKDLVSGSGTDGGYFVTPERSNRMVERIFETSPLRACADMQTTTSDVYEMILDDDEADAGWVGEVQPRDNTDTPTIGLLKIPVHEIFAQPRATQKQVDDAGFDIEGWLADKVADRISREENLAFVTGSGSQRPQGFLSYADFATPGQYQRNAVEQVRTGTNGQFDSDDIIQLKHTLFEEYQANAKFGMSRETFTAVMQLRDAEGQYLLNRQILKEGTDNMLLGCDVVFLNDMPNPATDSLSIVVADWKKFYTIVDRFDIRVLRDPYTQKPYIRYYTTKRTGGAVTNYEAGKILRLSA